MKLQKVRNFVLKSSKFLSVFSIIITLLLAFIIFLSKLFPYNDIFYSIDWLNELIMTCFGICCFYGSIFILPSLFGLSAILTGVIAFKKHNAKEYLDIRFLIVLAGIFLPLGLILLSENF